MKSVLPSCSCSCSCSGAEKILWIPEYEHEYEHEIGPELDS
jgi:hypothetical protein